ncbi:chromatin assembly factor 1 subunit A-domain-containing protein [Lactarius indigo]|nr:chromatin assembly factor 1 subunit A-domain-containing protein [Lactarius indigo]
MATVDPDDSPLHVDEVRDLPPPSTERQAKPCVDIKNGKAVFRQKPMSFEKMTETMQEMVNFREWLESRTQRQEPVLAQIPQNYWPLIAKFTQESDKTIVTLSKHIQQELAPDDDDDTDCSVSALPLSAIEDVVKLLATRVNYGIESPLAKTPAALCVWRWELNQEYLPFLPKVSREKVDARLADRVQYKKDLQAIFDALPANERNALLGVKGLATSPSKSQPLLRASSNEASPITGAVGNASDDKSPEKTMNAAGDENQMAARKAGRAKTTIDPEKAVERAAKEKKAAKAEKDRKYKESQEKARSIMANFFGKPRPSSSTVASPSKGPAASSSNTLSEFDRVFKPFVLKKDADLAPVNWFREARKRKRQADTDVIIIDEDDIEILDVEMHEPDCDPEANPRTHLRRVLSACPSLPTRSSSSPSTVRSIMARLSEAEVSDDTAVVRALLSELHDRTRTLAKVFIFHEDERPGYFGTFTKCSRLIKPRRPFARDDIVIDYSYDSGAEWGEEEEGGGDEIMGDSDDERDDEDDSDDLDGWLVDGDDGEAATPVEERDGLDAFPFPPLPEGGKHKRKVEKEKDTDTECKTKKRKAVVPLVPFIKGPCWETEIGDCEYEPFKHYRIRLFNDAPYPLDPFSFVSVPADGSSVTYTSGSKLQPQFVIPALPPHLLNSSTPVLDPAASNSTSSHQPQPKRPRTIPKNPFPDAHLPFLKEKVTSMGTTSLIALVEALYLDLKTHGVKKNAIEAKVREICVKGQRHIWSVKGDTEVSILFVVNDHI